MLVQRTIPILIERSDSLNNTIDEFNRYQKSISEECFNEGKIRNALSLHKIVYYEKKSSLCSQMRCTAIRLVAGAYASAKANKRPPIRPFVFRRKKALFLIGKKGRDASFSKSGKLSIWSIEGRKKLGFRIPEPFLDDFKRAKTIDSLTLGADGKGNLCLTLEVNEPKNIIPVGIDIGIKNALVASTREASFYISGNKLSEKRNRIRKTKSRIQSKKSSKKELGKDNRSIRRVLKSLSRKQRNFTKTFCREAAAKLCKWAPKDALLVFEDLRIKKVSKQEHVRKGTRRKLNSFCYNLMIQSVTNRGQRDGLGIDFVDPAYTSQVCNPCGLLGNRIGSRFSCPHCFHLDCADRNGSLNVLSRYTVLRGSGPQSIGPEDRTPVTVKPLPLGKGS